MKARRPLSGAAFGADVLKVVVKAFNDAWAEIEPSITDRPENIEAARLSLVNIVVSLAKDDTSDPEPLKNEALRIFRLKRPLANGPHEQKAPQPDLRRPQEPCPVRSASSMTIRSRRRSQGPTICSVW